MFMSCPHPYTCLDYYINVLMNMCIYILVCILEFIPMGWLRLVGSLKLQVSFAKEPSKRDDILQKRPIILRSLLIVGRWIAWCDRHSIWSHHSKETYITQKRPISLKRDLYRSKETYNTQKRPISLKRDNRNERIMSHMRSIVPTKEPYKRDDILQKRLIILRSLLIVATPYPHMWVRHDWFTFDGEVGGWGRDPKKCTGRDLGMGSSTI